MPAGAQRQATTGKDGKNLLIMALPTFFIYTATASALVTNDPSVAARHDGQQCHTAKLARQEQQRLGRLLGGQRVSLQDQRGPPDKA